MAWEFKTVGQAESSGIPTNISEGREHWLLAEETLTNDGTTSDQSTSVIDFLPYGKDFILSVSASATLATTAPLDLDYAEEKDGTFSELATTGLTLAATGAKVREIIDTSAKGNVPYLKIRLDKSGNLSTTTTKTIKIQVLVPPSDGIVY